MAKKVRRVKKKKTATDSATAVDALDAVAETPPVAARAQQSPDEQFREDYAYVIKDLRQVLLLSAVMFILLIALNLLLN